MQLVEYGHHVAGRRFVQFEWVASVRFQEVVSLPLIHSNVDKASTLYACGEYQASIIAS